MSHKPLPEHMINSIRPIWAGNLSVCIGSKRFSSNSHPSSKNAEDFGVVFHVVSKTKQCNERKRSDILTKMKLGKVSKDYTNCDWTDATEGHRKF